MSEKRARAPYTHPLKMPPLSAALGYRVKAAAEICGVADEAIYDALRTGQLEAVRWGTRTIITAESLKRFFKALPRAAFDDAEAAA